MDFINSILGVPLGYMMYLPYRLFENYGVSILLFTLFSKLLLFPISVMVQKNGIRMVKLQPELNRVKEWFAGDKDRIAEEQIKLYEREHYSPALGCLPLLLQIPFILGLISVIYHPLQHLMHLDAQTISALVKKAEEILGTTQLGSSPQMRVIDLIIQGGYGQAFASIPGMSGQVIVQIQSIRLDFLGLNLSSIPLWWPLTLQSVIPLGAGFSAYILCVVQNRFNVLQREQGKGNKIGMTLFLVAFSLYFAYSVPGGVGLYWIFSNLFALAQVFLLNILYPPAKFIDYASRPAPLTREEAARKKQEQAALRQREKKDIRRFFEEGDWHKQLVFYSERNGFYKYFRHVIDYLMDHSDIVIHYVTSDPVDVCFKRNDPRLIPYYVGDKALASFMLKVDADILVMTMPDLNQFHIKRSMARRDMEYIYMFHYPLSTHMVLRKGALDHYDTIFCVGEFQREEIRQSEKLYGTREKNLVFCGYGLMEDLHEQYQRMEKVQRARKKILIAPSWQIENLLDSCIDSLLDNLLGKGYALVVRPHPEYTKRYRQRLNALVEAYKDRAGEELSFELDFTDSSSIFNSDTVITDWSGTAYEFAFVTKKPVLFINTPPKINNPEYEKITVPPLEISLRDKIGIQVDPKELDTLPQLLDKLFVNAEVYRDTIAKIFQDTISSFGHSGEIGGQYILGRLGGKES